MFPLWLAPSLIALFVATVSIYSLINEKSIGDVVKRRMPNAFKLKIKEAKKNAVNVGIFDRQNSHLEDLKIESEQGVSDSVHKGQVIYLEN